MQITSTSTASELGTRAGDTRTQQTVHALRDAVSFVKMHGLGNDFLIVDAISHPNLAEVDFPSRAAAWCDRQTGIGADGILLITPHENADAAMTVVNADGSIAQMCGNGIRCVCKYLHDAGIIASQPMRIATGAGVLQLRYELQDGLVAAVTVNMGQPILAAADVPINVPAAARDMVQQAGGVVDLSMRDVVSKETCAACAQQPGLELAMTAVSMGNPHLILFCEDVAAIDLAAIGPLLEHDAMFPERINIHVVQMLDSQAARMRTWERGSGITQACGTGACAVCVAGVLTGRMQREITAHLPGGKLLLQWDEATGSVFMTGPAMRAFSGTIQC